MEVGYCVRYILQLIIALLLRCLVVCVPAFEGNTILEQSFLACGGVLLFRPGVYYSIYLPLGFTSDFDGSGVCVVLSRQWVCLVQVQKPGVEHREYLLHRLGKVQPVGSVINRPCDGV